MSAPASRTAVWAESGDVTTPSQGEQQSGFVTGKPPRRKANWLFNWVDNAVQWILGLGLPTYQAGQTYQPGARVVGADGQSYAWAHTEATTGVAPGSGGAGDHWVRWGHLPDQIQTLIDTRNGTYSGALADGTVTPTGDSEVSYCRALRFPNSTEKLVCLRLSLDKSVGGWLETLTLSGAAAFSAGADGVQVTVASLGGNSGTLGNVLGVVVDETTVSVSVSGGTLDGTNNLTLDVQIRGH